jgi:hypothetical protein
MRAPCFEMQRRLTGQGRPSLRLDGSVSQGSLPRPRICSSTHHAAAWWDNVHMARPQRVLKYAVRLPLTPVRYSYQPRPPFLLAVCLWIAWLAGCRQAGQAQTVRLPAHSTVLYQWNPANWPTAPTKAGTSCRPTCPMPKEEFGKLTPRGR